VSRRGRARPEADRGGVDIDLSTTIGSIALPNPVLTASGTAGHGAELHAYVDLAGLGAVVVKSLAAFEWKGNAAPRLHAATAGMINSVGLQGPGVEAWLHDELPALVATGARVVASIWGRSLDDYERAATLLADAPPAVVAVEVNLSCPNLKGKGMFAQSPADTAAAMAITAACGRPRWAKLTAAVASVAEIAAAAVEGGAEAVTLINTIPAMVLDPDTLRPVLGAGGGGLSGPAIHAVAVRAVFDVHAAHPAIAIVGAGGVSGARGAVDLIAAGAAAVEVGTASFADPRAPARVVAELAEWCRRRGVARLVELTGAAHTLT
jgi:dihydroorotate dehydrogenase (NAD+) catalytic subunit